ncbi:MAG: tRNA-dependent cyclodipeptide synthase [Holosporaceae bacterium]|jgi:cyclo(L-tyrosyl-L-tyrosyl) synthase|nr:tRNA-dependent cyclodipeptide synthase [Holosporaceae bacterium]
MKNASESIEIEHFNTTFEQLSNAQKPESVKIECFNAISERLFNTKEHALLGISPFNSYYVKENLEKLFSWALNTFKEITVFIPNEIAVYTLQAVGYPQQKAEKKTRRQDHYLKNKAIKALITSGLSEIEAQDKIVCLSDLTSNKVYIKLCNHCRDLYKNDNSFRNGCFLTSKWVLDGKCLGSTVENEQLDVAVQYFLAELPLYLDTPGILGVPSSLFVYKDPLPDFLQKIYIENLLVSPNQGYMMVNV